MELTEIQLLIVGAAGNVLVWLVRIIVSRANFSLPREGVAAVTYLVSVGLGIAFAGLEIPSGGVDVWIAFLTSSVAPILAMAWIVYQILGKRVLDALSEKAEVLSIL